jgi:hypothetical protein
MTTGYMKLLGIEDNVGRWRGQPTSVLVNLEP